MLWKAVAVTEGYYEVSDTGCVRSVSRTIHARNGCVRRLRGRSMTLTRTKGQGW